MGNYKTQIGYKPNSIEETIESLNLIREEMKVLKEKEDNLKESIFEYFSEKLKTAYKEKSEPFGVVNIQEGEHKLSFTTPKKVKWDQEGLEDMLTQGAPVDIEYNIKETIYKDLHDEDKERLMQYRTVEPGSVTIKIEYVS